MMKNLLRSILTIFLLFHFITVWAGGADTMVILNDTGGTSNTDGLRVYIGSNSQVQVAGWSTPSSAVDGVYPQMYSGCDTPGCAGYGTPQSGGMYNSIILRIDDGVDKRIYHNADDGTGYRTDVFTQVSQSAVSGTGTVDDPYVVVTVLSPPAPDNTVQVTITDTYVVPDPFFMRKIDLSGLDPTRQYKLYWYIDTFLAGDDSGYPIARTTPGNTTGIPDFIGVTRPGVLQGLQSNSGSPLWDHYYSSYWVNNIPKLIYDSSTGDLNNSVTTTDMEDNAIAVQWTIPLGSTAYQVITGQPYGASAVVSEAFSPQNISVNGASTLMITFANYDTSAATTTLDGTYHLPADISYVGTISNTCSAPAIISGNDLIFDNIVLGVASSTDSPAACTLSIDVTSATPGAYTGMFSGLSSGLSQILSTQRTLTVRQLKIVTPIPAINVIGLAALAALLGLLTAVHGLRSRERR
ncbi:MAG: hypothetical protein LBS40_05035 [Burkholderiales bacterium]|nr:hypothetical protein [Burkholderiales bacterium]